jgi:hypothetical protein
MPVTPFHFGAGALAKAMAPRLVSFSAFVCAQVVIDCETAYFMLWRHEWPFHRLAHTLLGGSIVGATVGAALYGMGLLWRRSVPADVAAGELARVPALTGGIVGGLSHSILDAIMHDDVRPFAPFSSANPLLDIVTLPALHAGLVMAAVIGIVVLSIRATRRT